MSIFKNALANESFQSRLNEEGRLRTRLATLADEESRGDNTRYAQLLVGPGRVFYHGEFGSSTGLQGLAGSAELERTRREIAVLPPLPRPSSNRKPPQTGGKKRRATKKARRNNRRVSRRNK